MSQVQTVKAATDIVQVLGERLQLQRSGTSWRALCPFHGERSPSFFVNEQFQRYKCFGCGESGDVFTFLEKYDGMTFGEAMKYLADRAGITLTSYQATPADEQRDRLLTILDLAKEYYHYVLTEHPAGEKARQYLKERGVTQETIKVFQLGYSLPAWEGLLSYIHKKKKYDLDDLVASGLIIQSQRDGKRHYDRFRDRIMFPLANHRGQVVGFSGRLLEKQTKEAKYINTPETSLYHKGQMLYGFSELYQEIRKKKELIIVEGEFDVISSSQAHVNHVAAIKGSALTTDHLRLIQRVAERMLLALDADEAGVKATERAIALTEGTALEVRVLVVPEGQDPDDLARRDPAAWRELTKSSISAYDFLIQSAIKQLGADSPESKRQVVVKMGPILDRIKLSVEQDVYIKKLASLLQVKEESLRKDIKVVSQQTGRRFGQAAPPSKSQAEPATAVPLESTPTSRLQRYLLFLLLKQSPVAVAPQALLLAELSWHEPGIEAVARTITQQLQTNPQATSWSWDGVGEDIKARIFELSFDPELVNQLGEVDSAAELQRTIQMVTKSQIKDQLQHISQELSQLDDKNERTPADEQRQAELLTKIVQLQAKLK